MEPTFELTLGQRAKRAWNIFRNKESFIDPWKYGPGSSTRPDRARFRLGNEKSIISSIYTRIALDVSSASIQHVQLDKDGRFIDVIHSGLHECLTVSANIDQSATAFLQDVVMSMLDEGCVAIVPIETVSSSETSGAYWIRTLRAGKIVQWYPTDVLVEVYNELTGMREEIRIPKAITAIIENPLYSIMNEPNSTLKRLIHKLNLLDQVDEQTSSGKLDLIIQLPYVIKSELRKHQAENRRKDIEHQLSGSKYGIAYTDGTEKITQLNRPAENNLLTQIEYLTGELYNQLGMSEAVFDGTADESVIANYYGRTIEPFVSRITSELNRKYLDFQARSEYQAIQHFRNPFDLVPISKIAEMADKFTRNEILSSNDVRLVIGFKASSDPRADQLVNKNISPNKIEDASVAQIETTTQSE